MDTFFDIMFFVWGIAFCIGIALHLKDNGRKKSVKNDSKKQTPPVHPNLQRYAPTKEAQPKQPSKPLRTKRHTDYQCPICDVMDDIKFIHIHDSIFNYPYRDEASIIKKTKCSTCKTPITIVVFKSGSVKAYNDAWEAERREAKRPVYAARKIEEDAEDDLDEVETEILNLEEDLIEDKKNNDIKLKIKEQKAMLPELKKKLKAAEEENNKEQLKYERVIDKYSDKLCRMREKLENYTEQ